MSPFDDLEELLHETRCTPDQVSTILSRMFKVRLTEVGILVVASDALAFLYPPELRAAGTIPLSSNAIAARTAVSRESAIFNRFVKVPHHNVFESVRVSDPELPNSEQSTAIQKLMSAPLIGEADEVIGVVQVCRKGADPTQAGPDFTAEDLALLERSARRIALLLPELQSARHTPRQGLRFLSTGLPKKLSRVVS
jgi:GAF domain-containing protein